MVTKTALKIILALALIASFSATAFANDNCTADKKFAVCKEDVIKERVAWACALIEKKGKDALPEISSMRYECCGEPNYVWINDMHPKMIMHPIKSTLDGKDLSDNKDPKGKKLFVEFVNAVKKTPGGDWVDYLWTKYGETDPTPKKSWVRKCKVGSTSDYWVAGSGTWL